MFADGRGVGEISRALDVPKSTLRLWRKGFDIPPCQQDTPTPARNAKGQFVPNYSGNPDGCSAATQRARTIIQDNAEGIVRLQLETLSTLAQTGDPEALRLLLKLSDSLLDRALGKAAQTQHNTHAGPDGEALPAAPPPTPDYFTNLASLLQQLGILPGSPDSTDAPDGE